MRPSFSLKHLRQITLAGLATFALSTPAAFAAEPDHAEHHPENTPAPSASTPAQSPAMPMPDLKEMQAHMLRMHEIMNRIVTTKDPKKRQKLMDEHLRMLQQEMTMGDMDMSHCDAEKEGGKHHQKGGM